MNQRDPLAAETIAALKAQHAQLVIDDEAERQERTRLYNAVQVLDDSHSDRSRKMGDIAAAIFALEKLT